MLPPDRARGLAAALSSALLAVGLPGTAAAQPPATPQPTFREAVTVTEVLLDVLVTDASGNVVVGLGKDDFVVKDEGVPVELASASFYSNRSFVGGPGPAPGDGSAIPQDRFFVLFFYRPPLALAGGDPARLYLKLPEAGRRTFEWLIEDLLPNDQVAVLGFDTRLRLYHDLSRDRERLGRAIEEAARGRAPEGRWPSRTAPTATGISLAPGLARAEAEETESDLYAAVTLLARALGTVPGRKNLILFGADFPPVGSTPDRRGYGPMVEALNTGNVAVYGLSVTGRGRQPSLDRLAEDTGGTYVYGFRSFREPLAKIAQENSGYYLLSFTAEHPRGESGFHRLVVRTKNEEFQVRARSGYRFGS
jgi:VWFA-related protein